MGGVCAFLDGVIVDFLGGQVAIIDVFMLFFEDPLVVIELEGHGDSANDLDLSALVDEDVVGVHAAYLFLQVLEFTARTNDIVEQVPDLSFQKIFSEALPVGDLGP